MAASEKSFPTRVDDAVGVLRSMEPIDHIGFAQRQLAALDVIDEDRGSVDPADLDPAIVLAHAQAHALLAIAKSLDKRS